MGFLDALGIGNQPNQLSLPEILSAIPAVAGPVLMQRGRRVGLPLGIGLSAIGGLGQTLADRQRTQAQHQRLGEMIGQMPGVTDKQREFFGNLVQAGVNPETFLPEVMKGMFPKTTGATGSRAVAMGQLGIPLNTDPNTLTKDQWSQIAAQENKNKLAGEKPPESAADKLNLYRQERQIAQQYKTPPKTPAQIAADAAARTTGTYDALSKMPISRWNHDVVVLSNDPALRIMPGGTEADISSGKGLPVLKSEIRQLQQAQTAMRTLDELDKTIAGALPKDPGLLSASGALGRKLTDVVNPTKLARFNAAKLGAADAFIRAITQRGNKAQFDAAMNGIVGPHATMGSAREGIAQAKQTINDLTTEITGRAGASLASAPLSAVPPPEPEAPDEMPPPPPGYE